MEEWKDIIVADSLGIVKTDIEEQYLSHLLCLGGTCRFFFNGQEFELREGDLCIIRRRSLVEKYARLPTSGAKSFTPNLASSS